MDVWDMQLPIQTHLRPLFESRPLFARSFALLCSTDVRDSPIIACCENEEGVASAFEENDRIGGAG